MLKTAVLCRTNAPLVTCAFDLIKRGVKVRLVGRDISKRLKEIVGEILDYRRNADIPEFLTLLDDWIEDIHRKYGDKEKHEDFVAECNDYYECLKVICNSVSSTDATSVYKVIDEFFVDSDELSDEDDSVILCSGHRSKGLEWERTIIIRPDLMPHPAAKTEADLEQEEHLQYVAYTRAKKVMVICHDREPV